MFGAWNRVNIIIAVILVINYTSGETDSPVLRRRKRIVGGIEASKPPEDDPVVFINKNGRDARIYGSRDERKGFYVFRGIRFAEPPVGRHRFQRPRRIQPEGNLNATKWGSPCPQPDREKVGGVIGTEDCLFLNIFTPALPEDKEEGYPVLVWIHGGSFRYGAACQYDMRNLIKMKMIVVSIQYRLGSLGFLSTGGKELPGNNGMFDMVLAVNWVREYVEFFGGDPKRIIAFGHGTGASSAMMLTLSKLTRNLFSGLIAMSGSALSHFAIDRGPISSARSIASANNCSIEDATEMTRCLQELPVENLIEADSALERIRTSVGGLVAEFGMLSPGPVVDGSDDGRSLPSFLTENPERFFELGEFPDIPLLTGVIKGETSGSVFARYRKELGKKSEELPSALLNENLIKTLQTTMAHLTIAENRSRQFVPEAFSKYLHISEGLSDGDVVSAEKILNKVAQVTGDALFNAPAFLTSQLWSKKGKTFLYSFDHFANGRNFQRGFPPYSKGEIVPSGALSHGDDLDYIFGRNSIFGERLTDAEDLGAADPEGEKVVETFAKMIGDFAQYGDILIPKNEYADDGILSKVQTFGGSDADTEKANPYISVTSKLRQMKDFRYCEMGLWAGLVQRVESTTCGLLKSSIETVERVNEETIDVVRKIGRGTVDVGEKLAEGVLKPKKFEQRAAVSVGNIIQGLVAGINTENGTNASETVKVDQMRNKVRPKMPNIGSLIPVRNFF